MYGRWKEYMQTATQTRGQQQYPVSFAQHKESPLKLNLETRNLSEVIILHCEGRLVYRDEAAALSRLAGELLHPGGKLVLDLSGIRLMDSAGIGDLALLQSMALERNAVLKCAGANALVQSLLSLTNLDTVLDLHPTVDAAMESLYEDRVLADC
jgi:anti-sigma B factor antagonist